MRLSYGSQASKSKAGIQLSSSSQFMDDNEVNHKQMHHTCKVVSTSFRFINSCSCPTTFFLLHTNHHCPGSYQKLGISSSKVKIEITVKKSPLTVYAHTNLPKKNRSYVPKIFCLISTFARSTGSILAFALKISVTSLKLNDFVLARMLEFLERQLNMNMISKFHTGIVFPPFSLHKSIIRQNFLTGIKMKIYLYTTSGREKSISLYREKTHG